MWGAGKVLDWLYLGGAKDARDLAHIREHEITHILNVSDDVPNYHENLPDVALTYKKLHVRDYGEDAGIRRVFDEAFAFIEAGRTSPRGKVLVHCMQGQNRSVTIVAAFLVGKMDRTLATAMHLIRQVRPIACPFRDNRQELVMYEVEVHGCSTFTANDFITRRAAAATAPDNNNSLTTPTLRIIEALSRAFGEEEEEQQPPRPVRPLAATLSILDDHSDHA